MSIKLIHTCDWHIGETSSIPINKQVKNVPTPVNIRTIDTFKRIRSMVEYAIANKISYFIIAGDVYNKPVVSMYLKKWFAKYISKLLKNNIKVIIIIGNHDSDGNVNAFSDIKELLNDTSGLYIIDSGKTIHTKHFKFFCIPYISGEDYKSYTRDIKNQRDFDKKNVLVGHLGVEWAVVGKDQIALPGDVGIKYLKGYDYVALGDYHINQKVGDEKTKKANEIWYAGSIIRLNMSEPEKKYFNVVTFGKNSKLPKIERIELPDRNYITRETTLSLMKKAVRTKRIELPINKGDVVKFKCQAKAVDAIQIEEKYLKLIYKKFKPIYASIDWSYSKAGKEKTEGYKSSIDPIKAMELYIRRNNLNIDVKKLMELHEMIVRKYGEGRWE